MTGKRIAILGTGFISDFYVSTLLSTRSPDKVISVYSRSDDRGKAFADKYGLSEYYTDLTEIVSSDAIDTVIIGLPNHLHLEAVLATAKAGKAVLCTKPLGRTATEAYQMLLAVEEAGVFHGYLEDLVYTHKTLRALQ
ncbi:unnamed protein product, partial [Laminaria digitata]